MEDRTGVACRVHGTAGHLTLDRAEALNALNLPMIRHMHAALDLWEDDDAVSVVVLDSASPRAFCAGGDIGVVHRSARSDPEQARQLWREEYRLDARLTRYPKPVVTLIDGLALGGGMGIGCHAAVRVVTERAQLAMPEVAIGLAPDVAGTWLLTHAPGRIGTHLALTGTRVGAGDAVYCGLADHVVDSSLLRQLRADLFAGCPPAETVAKYSRPPEPTLAEHRAWIDRCYTPVDVAAIVEELRATAATDALNALAAGSPTALKVTLRALQRASTIPAIEDCLVQDYRVCSRFLAHPDLEEGIRAKIIDKDHAPRWNPARLDEISDADVERFFAPLPDDLRL
ncbi:enoyl-CoA hydratase/carnithine racemase [Prauserella sp. Am3]|nr:enoyl-CoA hydratase/carnithine racemase [Prauserella sp. Am3]